LAISLQATMCQTSQDLIHIPAGRSQRLTPKVKGTTSQATRALNVTVSSASFALSVWLCVCVCVLKLLPFFHQQCWQIFCPSGNISLLEYARKLAKRWCMGRGNLCPVYGQDVGEWPEYGQSTWLLQD